MMAARGKQDESQHLIEEGEAFARITGRQLRERHDVVVVGGGQAGLSVGYHLARRGLNFVILDQSRRIGDSWRTRWDSLRLFTPARYDGLDGMRFSGDPDSFPTKDEMADYLEAYAARFHLPVRSGVRVEKIRRQGRNYVVQTGGRELEAAHVVIAMSGYQRPHVPPFAEQLDPDIVQLHSCAYRNPSQLRDGPVLIAGAGNSGSEIALELVRRHRTFMSGRDTGQLPFRIAGVLGRTLLVRLLLRVVFHRVLTTSTAIGRALRPKFLRGGGPLIRVRRKQLAAAGVELTGRTAGVEGGLPVLEDGRTLDVKNVIWCTGFEAGLSFLDLPVFGSDGLPRHRRGVVEGEPGLYFVGQHFLHAMSSTMIHGVGRDAEYVVCTLAARLGERGAVHEELLAATSRA